MNLPSAFRFTATAAIAGVALLQAGCLQMEHNLTINNNGSASYRLDYAITEQAITRFQSVFRLKNQLAVAAGKPAPGPEMHPLLLVFLNPTEAGIRTELARFEPLGVSIQSLRQSTRAASRHFELHLEIEDLARLQAAPFFQEHGFDLFKNENGHYVFNRQPHIMDPGAIPAAPSGQDLNQIRPLMEGFNTTLKVTVPGRILSSTATRTSLQTATWTFDFNTEPAAISTLQRQHFRVVFEAATLELPEWRHTPEGHGTP